MYTIQDKLSADVKNYAHHRKMMNEMCKRIDSEARELLSELRKVKGWECMIKECEEHYAKYPDEFFDWCSVTHTDDSVQFVKGYSDGEEYVVLEISFRKSLKDQVHDRMDYLEEQREKQGEKKPLIEMKSPEESLGMSTKEYNGVVNDSLYGESKSADKDKPKFKVGDWITDGEQVWKIGCIEDNMYIEHRGTISGGGTIESIDKHYHLWTIEDAKDGDVLVDAYGNIGVCEKTDSSYWTSYCFMWDSGYFADFGAMHENDKTYPATKEQRDTLFNAMADAGYEFDFEKKKLKIVKYFVNSK